MFAASDTLFCRSMGRLHRVSTPTRHRRAVDAMTHRLHQRRYGSSCTPPTNAVDDEKDAAKLDKAVEASKPTAEEAVGAAKAVA